MASVVLKQSTAASISTPDTGKTAVFVDSADLALKIRDAGGVLLPMGRWIGTPISPAQIVANTDNYAPTGLSTAGWLRLNTDASRNLTGMTAATDGIAKLISNVGAFDLVLKHDATSTAANRFYCPGNADLTLNAGDSAWAVYDATSSRWRVLGF